MKIMGIMDRIGGFFKPTSPQKFAIGKFTKETDITHYGFIEEIDEAERTVKFRYLDVKNDQTCICQLRFKQIESPWRGMVLTPILITFDPRTKYTSFEKINPSHYIEEAIISDVENWIKKFIRKNRKESPFDEEWLNIRTRVLKRDCYKCVNCGKTGSELHIHHIIPKARGGSNKLSNLVSLCKTCHSIQDAKGHELIKTDED